MEKRILTGKTSKINPEDRDRIRAQRMKERIEFEKDRTGGYELIFPSDDPEQNLLYQSFITKANDLWDDFTTGKGKKPGENIPQSNPKAKQTNNLIR